MKEEAKKLSDENKSLMTAIRLLNNDLHNVLKAEESCFKNTNLNRAENLHDDQRQVKRKTATQQQKATESRKPKLPKDPGNNTSTRNSAEVTPSAVTKSGTGTWDLGRGDSGTWGRGDVGTWGLGDVGTRGLGDVGTRGRGDVGTWGRGDSGTWGLGDVGTRRHIFEV